MSLIISNEQLRVAHHSSAHCEHLLFAAGKSARYLRLSLAEAGEAGADLVDILFYLLFVLLRIRAEEQIFIDGQLLEHAATLGHLAHSHADQLMTGNLVYLVSVIDDGAA